MMLTRRKVSMMGGVAALPLAFVKNSRAGFFGPFMLNGPSAPSSGWADLPIGAGGFVTGISISQDNHVVVRTDTYGAYLWNPNVAAPNGTMGTWQQLCSSTSMPSNFTIMGNAVGSGTGVWEIQIGWSDNTLYMVWSDVVDTYPLNQAVYKSTNLGQTWTKTGFTAINFQIDLGGDDAGGTDAVKTWGPKLSIDPTNSNNVCVGTGANGIWSTTNGGTTWSPVSASNVPFAWSYAGINTSGNATLTGGTTGVAATGVFNFNFNPTNGSGINFQGGGITFVSEAAWSSGTTYSDGQSVYGSNNHVYTSLSNGNVGNNPVSDGGVHWQDANGRSLQIQSSLSATLSSAATVLGASTDSTIDLCTYAATSTALELTYGTTGTAGNSFQISVNSYWPGHSLCIGVYSGTQYVLASSYGNGAYLATNGTWANISSGGPSEIQTIVFDRNTGYFYCVDTLGNAWQYTASAGSPAWLKIYSTGTNVAQDIAVDPNNANHLIITNGNGQLAESTNGTSFGTWATHTQTGQPVTTGDIPWMSLFNGCNAHRIVFDSLTSKTIWGASDREVLQTSWTGTLSSSANVSWNSLGRGIEQLVGQVVTVPSTNNPILGVWDSGLISNLTLVPAGYPSAANFFPGTTEVIACWSIDYAINNSSFVAALLDNGGGIDGGAGDTSVFSTNGGASWAPFPSSAPGSGNGGSLAVSTSANMVFAPGGQQPQYTLNFNSGTTWANSSVSGVSNFSAISADLFGGKSVAADGAITGKFYLFIPNVGFFVSTDGGATFSSLVTFTTGVSGAYIIKATPGESDDFWFTGNGSQGGQLYHYYGGNLVEITNAPAIKAIGFGANSGAGYPSVFLAGFVGAGSGTYGVYRGDNAATGAAPSWNSLGLPQGVMDAPRDISGDPAIYGKCYIAFTGTSFRYYNP
jgi:hypothetical protein